MFHSQCDVVSIRLQGTPDECEQIIAVLDALAWLQKTGEILPVLRDVSIEPVFVVAQYEMRNEPGKISRYGRLELIQVVSNA